MILFVTSGERENYHEDQMKKITLPFGLLIHCHLCKVHSKRIIFLKKLNCKEILRGMMTEWNGPFLLSRMNKLFKEGREGLD